MRLASHPVLSHEQVTGQASFCFVPLGPEVTRRYSFFFWGSSIFVLWLCPVRRKIGKALGKTIKVSAVGVYSFDGAHEQQKQVRKERGLTRYVV